jgi:midasin (ATPase involved in ribosome maturation)
MNEQFGELSRPMRNRGCEIYLPELDTSEDLEDIFIILNTLFPLRHAFYSKEIKFADLFKIYKLAYDYWLIDTVKCKGKDKE